jgi:hypothetical protein
LLEDRNQPDPFGGNNASIIRIDSIGGSIQRATTGSSGAQYSGAFWIKRIAGSGDCNLRVVENANIVVPVTNQWQRFTATRTSTTTVLRIGVGGATIGDEFAIYQAQLETGPVSTSDIITSGSTVTRVADECYKTGISSLIGQTEGVLFLDFIAETPSEVRRVSLSNSDTQNRILIAHQASGKIQFFGNGSGGTQFVFETTQVYTKGDRVKVALAYKQNDFAGYINGVQMFTNNSGNVATSLFNFNFSDAGAGVNPFFGSVNQALLFKTRLTNAQLAELTTL